jgi:hypothetical protein
LLIYSPTIINGREESDMGKAKRMMAPVSRRALIQRINRKLRATNELLRAYRGDGRGRQNLGDLYVLDLRRNFAVRTHVDLEQIGRELGVLHAWEEVE